MAFTAEQTKVLTELGLIFENDDHEPCTNFTSEAIEGLSEEDQQLLINVGLLLAKTEED